MTNDSLDTLGIVPRQPRRTVRAVRTERAGFRFSRVLTQCPLIPWTEPREGASSEIHRAPILHVCVKTRQLKLTHDSTADLANPCRPILAIFKKITIWQQHPISA